MISKAPKLLFYYSICEIISNDSIYQAEEEWGWSISTGCPKKMVIQKGFEFLTLEGVFLGVKNNSKNFGNKKILGCLAKFWVNGPCFIENLTIFLSFYDLVELIGESQKYVLIGSD